MLVNGKKRDHTLHPNWFDKNGVWVIVAIEWAKDCTDVEWKSLILEAGLHSLIICCQPLLRSHWRLKSMIGFVGLEGLLR